MTSPFDTGLEANDANSMPLDPVSFLVQAAAAFPDRAAMIHRDSVLTYAQLLERSVRLASALHQCGVRKGDVVSLMATNTPEALEAHYGVPMLGAVLNPINTRLDSAGIAFILDHAETRAVLTDIEFAPTMAAALDAASTRPPLIIDIVDDPHLGEPIGHLTYDALLHEGDPEFAWPGVVNERQAVCLSYTSGTTGDPKGVVSNARQIYLNSLGQVTLWALPRHPVYLWTLPMFHAIGWCMPYAIVIMAGTQVGLRRFSPAETLRLIEEHRVTHLCAAPILLNEIRNFVGDNPSPLPHPVSVLTAGSAPPPAVLAGAAELGFDVTHVYGMTEAGGVQTYSPIQTQWSTFDADQLAAAKARQGVGIPTLQGGMIVADGTSFEPVPKDGETVGEVMMRANTMMSGYLKNPAATQDAFAGGWLHTGDLAVWHPDGYVEIKDRSKDIIISGGENISSIEVENVLYQHPEILEAAVIAAPDHRWGETPCAFVTITDQSDVDEAAIINYCRERLAHFKCPTRVVFGPLPKTSTGKIQKFQLRARLNDS